MKLLSYLYQEALDNCSNEHYPVLLSLLKTSCEPYTRWGPRSPLVTHLLRPGVVREEGAAPLGLDVGTWGGPPPPWPHAPHGWLGHPGRFIHDWVYSGVFRDVYGEFMIQVNHEYLGFRGR